jgi:hypothetical protein
MEKVTLYKISIGGLLLLNFVLVAFLWFGRPNPEQPPLRAVERFDLSQEQNDQFFKSVEAHQADLQRIREEQRGMLRDYFEALKVPTNNTSIPVPPEILGLERQKIQASYDHFLEVKGLLTPKQLAEYPDFIDYVIKRVIEKNQKNLPPRRKGKEPLSNR